MLNINYVSKISWMYLLITIVLIVIIIIILGILLWYQSSTNTNASTNIQPIQSEGGGQYNYQPLIYETIINDSYLQRLLMIEIINDKDPTMMGSSVTFNKMLNQIETLGKILTQFFGMTLSQKLVKLIHNRYEVIRDYYRCMRNLICENNFCVISSTDEISEKSLVAFPNNKQTGSDLTTITLNKMETITQQIISLFHIDQFTMKYYTYEDNYETKVSLVTRYQKLFTLITMYDKELINQAKTYALKQYDISINCAESSIEIVHHINNELHILIN